MAITETYAPDRMGREWGYKSSDYAGGVHRGQDIRKVHSSGKYSVVETVESLSDGKVVNVFRPNKLLQLTIVVDTGRPKGRYEFHSHLATPSVKKGDRVESGDRLARNAEMDENPGKIKGVHDHFVISDYPDGAWNTDRPTYDPLPFIKNALAAAAGGGSKPFEPEDDMPLTEAEMDRIAAKSAAAILARSTPGLEESTGGPIPDESVARRWRVIRAHTNGIPTHFAEVKALLAAQTAAIKELAKAKNVDPATIEAAIKKGVAEGLKGISVTLTIGDEPE